MKNTRSQTTFSIALLLTAPLALSACGLPPTSSDETTAASSTSATTESTSGTETTISSPSLANKAFLELPESIAGVPRQSQEVDNPNNTAIIFYADETQEFRVRAILGDPPIVGEDQAEVREGFIDNYLTEMNLSFPTQSDTHKGICATTFGDRIVEFQFFSSAHDGDPEQRTEEIAKGLAEALNSLQA